MNQSNTHTADYKPTEAEGKKMAEEIAKKMGHGEELKLPTEEDLIAIIKKLAKERDQIMNEAKERAATFDDKIAELKKQLQKLVSKI